MGGLVEDQHARAEGKAASQDDFLLVSAAQAGDSCREACRLDGEVPDLFRGKRLSFPGLTFMNTPTRSCRRLTLRLSCTERTENKP